MANVISTVSNDQRDILLSILRLYIPDGHFECDPTYSKGNFYDGVLVPEPSYKFDIAVPEPDHFALSREKVMHGDCRNLPLDSASIRSIVFDPPFIHAHGKESEIGNRFSSYPTQHALRAMYMASLVEFYRILKTGGILVFKNQDIVESGKNVFNHVKIYNLAVDLGFVALDLFIQTADNRIIGHNHHEQQHARKFHCFWWIFEKGTRR